MKKLAVLLAVSTLALGGCSWSWPWSSSSASASASVDGAVTKDSVAATIAAAEAAMKKADAVGGGWRDTEKLVKEAKAALDKGELDNAAKLAKAAQEEAKLGEQQAMDNKGAKPWLF